MTLAASSPRSIALASFMLSIRRRRETVFPDLDVGDLAWNLLLDLYIHHGVERRVSITALCATAGAPTSTALRHVNALIDSGIFTREPDPLDRRRAFVRLAPQVIAALDQFLSDQFQRAQTTLRD
ncbi:MULTISPECIES: MarR family winged helix-turn-helix transcriptional regulator [Sphingomonas]|nr:MULTISPECIES: MarR family winged helix-turn-helix transcriptional regulator [Sphingomonas]